MTLRDVRKPRRPPHAHAMAAPPAARPKWVYLLVEPRGGAYVGLASHPFHRVRCHNREDGYATFTKSTRAAAPHWQLVLVLGPCFRGGSAVREWWRRELRRQRRKRGGGSSGGTPTPVPAEVPGLALAHAWAAQGLGAFGPDPARLQRLWRAFRGHVKAPTLGAGRLVCSGS